MGLALRIDPFIDGYTLQDRSETTADVRVLQLR
jgi:hypothetical protein